MDEKQLAGIVDRNKKRKELKNATTPGEWLYDSFAFVDTGEELPKAKQMGILVRPRTWFEKLFDEYGRSVLDRWTEKRGGKGNLQPYHDARFIVEAHNDTVEDDVDVLVAEVKRLRSKS